MDNYEKFFDTICRVCLTAQDGCKMFSLTENNAEDGLSCYGKAASIFTNIHIKNDFYPKNMCHKCLFMLQQAIIFKKKCESSQCKLEKIEEKYGQSKAQFQEQVSQYVIYTQTFDSEIKSPSKESTRKIVEIVKKHKDFIKSESFNTFNEVDSEYSDYNDDSTFLLKQEHYEEPKETEKTESDQLFDRIEAMIRVQPQILLCDLKKNKKVTIKTKLLKAKSQRTTKILKKIPKKKETENVQCNICNKTFANISTLNHHVQRHKQRRFICEHCGKAYPTSSELQYHLASTHDIGPHHICKICGFKAPKRFELIEHERLHTGERPFACDKCGLTFRRRFIWKKHAIYHTERTVQCPLCPRKFHREVEMRAHKNNVHERVYVFSCNECDVTYAKASTVRRHLIEKHGVAREVQGRIRRIKLVEPLR